MYLGAVYILLLFSPSYSAWLISFPFPSFLYLQPFVHFSSCFIFLLSFYLSSFPRYICPASLPSLSPCISAFPPSLSSAFFLLCLCLFFSFILFQIFRVSYLIIFLSPLILSLSRLFYPPYSVPLSVFASPLLISYIYILIFR